MVDFELLALPNRFKFNPGNLIDLLAAYHINKGRHRFEFGYNASFLCNAKIFPNLDDIVNRTNYIRSNFYASYGFIYLLGSHPSGFAFALSGGFDHSPKKYGIKHVITVWGIWGINF